MRILLMDLYLCPHEHIFHCVFDQDALLDCSAPGGDMGESITGDCLINADIIINLNAL